MVAATLTVAAAVAAPAQAGRRFTKTGRPGAATMPAMLGWYGGGYPDSHTLRFAGRQVWRSPTYPRRTQRICIKFRTFHLVPSSLGEPPRWINSWQSGWGCSDIPAVRGASMTASAFDFEPRGGVAYHAEFSLLWKVGARRIASASYTYNRPADYSCQTMYCWADYGYKNIAYIQIGGGFSY